MNAPAPPRAVLLVPSTFFGVRYAEHDLRWRRTGTHRYLSGKGEETAVVSEQSDVMRALRGSGITSIYVAPGCTSRAIANVTALFPGMKLTYV